MNNIDLKKPQVLFALYNTLIQFNFSSNRKDIINITPDED